MTECNGYCHGSCKDCDANVTVREVTFVNIGVGCKHKDTIPVQASKCLKCGSITVPYDPWV